MIPWKKGNSVDAASWCELATVGEIYEFREGEIEIQEID